MEEFLRTILPGLLRYKGRIMGLFIGIMAGIFWAAKGFRAALIFVICVVGGYWMGKRHDLKGPLSESIKRILPPRQ